MLPSFVELNIVELKSENLVYPAFFDTVAFMQHVRGTERKLEGHIQCAARLSTSPPKAWMRSITAKSAITFFHVTFLRCFGSSHNTK